MEGERGLEESLQIPIFSGGEKKGKRNCAAIIQKKKSPASGKERLKHRKEGGRSSDIAVFGKKKGERRNLTTLRGKRSELVDARKRKKKNETMRKREGKALLLQFGKKGKGKEETYFKRTQVKTM